MRLGLVPTVVLCCAAIPTAAFAGAAQDRCQRPPDLHDAVSTTYPNARIVDVADLGADDRKFFEKDHRAQCPGLIRVEFYGDAKPTWALVLFDHSTKEHALVVAHKLEGWEFSMLETWSGGPMPVVWREKPGKYDDIYGDKTIRAMHPVIVYCGYEAWAIVYAWMDGKVEKVWISD